MTPRQVRSKAAIVTTTVGLAVLLAGPAATFGLGVPSVGGSDGATSQVTDTAQTVVQTTQQTAATTVTNVESAVQPTVQATAPQPAAPAAQPKASAPASKPAATRVAAPVKRQAAAVAQPRTTVTKLAATTQIAKQAGGASAKPVRVVAVKPSGARTQRAPARSTTTSAADAPPAGCDVPELALVPGGAQVQALLSIVCSAAGPLDLPSRLGLSAPASGAHASGGAPGSSPSGDPVSSIRARSAAQPLRHTGVAATGRSAISPQAGAAGLPLSSTRVATGGSGARLTFPAMFQAAQVASAAGSRSNASSGASPHHHGFFSGQTRGTEILMAIIFANLAILAGIALWRLAVRFVIPRFA